MVISCSSCQKEEKEYLIYTVLSRFQICCNLRVFSAKSVFPKLQSSQKNVFFQVCDGGGVGYCNAGWIVVLADVSVPVVIR